MRETNWAGNLVYAAKRLHAPASLEELQELARRSQSLRPLGSRHSFNGLADTAGDLVSMRRLNHILEIDAATRTVVVEGGITYGELCPALDAAGFALPNLASLPHISVAGAIATATHGSGNANRNLASAVAAFDLVTASGDIVQVKRGDAAFDGAVVALGALGIVSRITLDIVPHFEMRQDVFTGLAFATLVENFDAIAATAYSVSCFTAWHGETVDLVWLKSLADAPPTRDMFGAVSATRPWHPIKSMNPAPCTEQLGVPGPWYERLPHFRMAFTPSAGAELQSEYFVPRGDAGTALKLLKAIEGEIAAPLMISEIRTIAADRFWLSPSHQQDSVAFHFTWRQDWPAVRQAIGAIETALAPLQPRPHWGKLFTMPKAELQSRYSRLGDFRALAARHDPDCKFRNTFLDALLF